MDARTLTKAPDGTTHRFGDWIITPASWTRPSPAFDWDFYHDDYDGAPDAHDWRHGSASDPDACVAAILALEDEHAD